MTDHHDPRLLFSVDGIKAYHIQDGEESDLTPSGAQVLSLLMVPTTSPFADKGAAPEEDFYLHLNLPPELDLPLPATTQIYHHPPRSYLIPRWDLGSDSGAFTRIEFPPLGRGVKQEDVDTFETILAQCTAFLERAQPPPKGQMEYNPANYKPGEAYAAGTGKHHGGQIVLIDEDNGSVVGELGEDASIYEDAALKPGQKDPVQITISADGKRVDVKPIDDEYLYLARHPAYSDSAIVQNAAAASRILVNTSGYIGNLLASGAENFTAKTKPAKPLVFTPITHERVRKINSMTAGAASLSSKTVGQATKIAQNVGATLARRGERKTKEGKLADDNYKPGLLNKSMIAFSTIADGVATSGKHLLATGGSAATHIVGHRYGEDARKVASELTHGITNVGLVYIDVTGVSRKAVIKSVAKGMVVGRVAGGGDVVVGGENGSDLVVTDHVGGQVPGLSSSSGIGPPGYSVGDYKPSALPEKESYR